MDQLLQASELSDAVAATISSQNTILDDLLSRIEKRKRLAESKTGESLKLHLAAVLSFYDQLRIDIVSEFNSFHSEMIRIETSVSRYAKLFATTVSQPTLFSQIIADADSRLTLTLTKWKRTVLFANEMLR